MALVNSGRVGVSGLIAWDVVDVTETGTAIQISKVEVSNDNGADMEIGWGEELPIVVGKMVSGTFSEITLPYTFGADEFLAIIAPKKVDALDITIDTAATNATTLGVYNGTNFTAVSLSADKGALTFNGGSPVATAITLPANSWQKGGITGYSDRYCIVSTNAVALEISEVRAGRVIDFVSTVANGNHAFREYSIEPLMLHKNQGLFVYAGDSAQTTSIATVDYQQI